MKISFSTVPGNLNRNVGYGYAGYNMVTSLQRLGHQVPYQDPTAPVQIHFSQPQWYEFNDSDQYRIGYTPWESSALPEGWLEDFNLIDELWTPSDIVANWYKEAGVEKDVKVYEHGLDHEWRSYRRTRGNVLRFFHHGEPAPRKGGQIALEAFREAFGDRKDVHLTIKSHGASTVRAYQGRYYPGAQFFADGQPHHVYNNVSLVTKDMSLEELIGFYHSQDVLVYPGWGEGYGLIPQQAMGTGMPTICTEAWAPYRRFILPELSLKSKLADSPWPHVHPGKMFEPDFDNLVEAYLKCDQDYDRLAGRAYRKSFDMHEALDWDVLTEAAFREIVTKFG